MKSEQHNGYSNEKEHIVNDINELKQQIILIENKLRELRIFYITNKDKYDYDYKLAKTFLDNLQNFIEKEIINVDMYFMFDVRENSLDYEHFRRFNDYIIFNYRHQDYKNYIENYVAYSKTFNNPNIYTDPVQYKSDKITADYNFKLICKICNCGEDMLIIGMLIKEKKLKCYENLINLYPEKPDIFDIMELYPEKPDIENIMELSPECEKPEIKNKQYSMSASVIFLIMIVFYVMTVATVILLVNYNQNLNYNTAVLYHPVQCTQTPLQKTTRFIVNHNKFKDIMLV